MASEDTTDHWARAPWTAPWGATPGCACGAPDVAEPRCVPVRPTFLFQLGS